MRKHGFLSIISENLQRFTDEKYKSPEKDIPMPYVKPAPMASIRDTGVLVRVKVDNLTKFYGTRPVLRSIYFDTVAGSVLSITGANGTGKSTLLRILAGLVRPDSGSALVNGFDVISQGPYARQTVGAVLHSPMLYSDLTLKENLMFTAAMFRISDATSVCEDTAERMKIADVLNKRVRLLSRGMLQRAAIARALLHRPSLLILDEPETGLDTAARVILDDVIKEYRDEGRSVIITSHSLEWVLDICDFAIALNAGRVALSEKCNTLTVGRLKQAQANPTA